MDENISLPFAESYWVLPGRYLAGEHPAKSDELTTRRRLQAIIQCNVSAILDFTEKGDSRLIYSDWLKEEAAGYERQMDYWNYPIPDFTAPDKNLMKEILDKIEEELSAGKTIYTHCVAGVGRTGMVTGCYLVRHGWTGEQALERIKLLRSEMPSWWKSSPEDPSQVELILRWKPGM